MDKKVPYKPERYHTVTPYLVVHDVQGLIDFLKNVFNADEIERLNASDGRIMHAEVRIGDSVVMMGGANEQNQPFPGMLHLYIEDIDAVYLKALEFGAVSLREPFDEFYGDRVAGVKDIHGNQWWLATHFEDVSTVEMERRAASL